MSKWIVSFVVFASICIRVIIWQIEKERQKTNKLKTSINSLLDAIAVDAAKQIEIAIQKAEGLILEKSFREEYFQIPGMHLWNLEVIEMGTKNRRLSMLIRPWTHNTLDVSIEVGVVGEGVWMYPLWDYQTAIRNIEAHIKNHRLEHHSR